MCNTALHINTLDNANESFSTFSTLHLLRTCNRLMLPNTILQPCYNFENDHNETSALQESNRNSTPFSPELNITDLSTIESDSRIVTSTDSDEGNENLKSMETINTSDSNFSFYKNGNGLLPLSLGNFGFLPDNKKNNLPGFQYIAPPASQLSITSPVEFPLMELNRTATAYPLFMHRRSRGEKRPIPEEQKDEKYFERRKRNNEAAKKSRDARKLREDRIAFRAALLEQENSILRAQLLSLRDELQAMRQIISTTTSTATTTM